MPVIPKSSRYQKSKKKKKKEGTAIAGSAENGC